MAEVLCAGPAVAVSAGQAVARACPFVAAGACAAGSGTLRACGCNTSATHRQWWAPGHRWAPPPWPHTPYWCAGGRHRRTERAGICVTDLHFANGGFPYPVPTVLGHEAVGADVDDFTPGDRAIVCDHVFCGRRGPCLSGHMVYRTDSALKERQKNRLCIDSQPVRQYLGVSAFAEMMLVDSNALMAMPDGLSFDAAALRSCCLTTGLVAVFNVARPAPGARVAVFGCDGVGLGAVQAARIAVLHSLRRPPSAGEPDTAANEPSNFSRLDVLNPTSPPTVDAEGSGPREHGLDEHAPSPSPAPPNAQTTVRVTVLGAAGIAEPDRSPRAKSFELLVYLAVNDGAALIDSILEDLLPDAPLRRAGHRLHTYVSDLRTVLRRTAGPGTYITRTGHRYALEPDRFDIDLWRMRAALTDAAHADTPRARITALHTALDTYRGPLAATADYPWAEPYREAIRQQAVDAALALTDTLDDPTEKLAVLDTAIGHHPHTESLSRAAMRVHAGLGRIDTIRALHQAVTRRAAELDTEPEPETTALAAALTAKLQQRRTRTTPTGTADRPTRPPNP